MRKIVAAFLLAVFLPGIAFAQTPRPRPLTGNVIEDIKNAAKPGQPEQESNLGADIRDLLAKPFLDLAKFIGEDANDAITLSTAVPGLQDGHGQGCWIATRKFAAVLKVHPVPLTLKAQTDLEAIRLLSMAAKELCTNVHCTQVFADLKSGVDQIAPLKAPNLSLNFHDVCALVPTVAVTEPTLPVPPDPGQTVTNPPTPPTPPAPTPPANP